MTFDHPERVYLTGAREGAYLVTEERADGSLTLKRDDAPRLRRRRAPREVTDDLGPLAHLFRRRPEPTRTADAALDAWGVDLLDDEALGEFLLADIDERHGFVAVTNHRLIFLERNGAVLQPRQEHPLSQLMSVEPMARGRKARLMIKWDGAPPMSINSTNRAQLERLRAQLLSPPTSTARPGS
jgi:hypothetical protein